MGHFEDVSFPPMADKPVTVNEACDRFESHADRYYRRRSIDHGGERIHTGHHLNMREALQALREVAGGKAPEDLRCEDMCACQEYWLARPTRRGTPRKRKQINAKIERVLQAIRWMTRPPRRWLPTWAYEDCRLVESLKRDRTDAAESQDVQPADWDSQIGRTLDALANEWIKEPSKQLQCLMLSAMIEIGWESGMRPGELVRMRRSELCIERPQLNLWDATAEVMVYKPAEHKTRHHGIDRNIFLSPIARRLVEDCMTKIPQQRDRLFPYSVDTFRQMIARVNKRHRIPHWFPYQLRHAFATRIRLQSGIDVVQVLMGHRHRSTTEIYAKPDAAAAISAILRFG